MEQLVMQTQQSMDVKTKLPSKKTQNAKEKQTDFGKALEQQAASYAQAAASDVNAQAQTQQAAAEPTAAGVSGISGLQSQGIIGMTVLQEWALPQENTLMQNGSTQEQTVQNTAFTILTGASAENPAAVTGIPVQNTAQTEAQAAALNEELVPAVPKAAETETADTAASQTNEKNDAALTAAVSNSEDGSRKAAVKTDERTDFSDVSAVKPQQSDPNTTAKAETTEQTARPSEMKPEYADMLKDMIAKQISNGKQELEIKLTPRSLGDLTVKVNYHDGAAVISIICSDKKALQAMSQKAGELGLILENNLGSRTEVVVESREESSRLYEDGRGQQSYQGQQDSRQQSEHKHNETETIDFLQQLRLGIRKESESIWQ